MWRSILDIKNKILGGGGDTILVCLDASYPRYATGAEGVSIAYLHDIKKSYFNNFIR